MNYRLVSAPGVVATRPTGEGNYALPDILGGSRKSEAEPVAKPPAK